MSVLVGSTTTATTASSPSRIVNAVVARTSSVRTRSSRTATSCNRDRTALASSKSPKPSV